MANLPSQHPTLSLHLSDRALTPLITSARTRPHLESLTSLSHGALSAHESALRLGLGAPQRVMVEHSGSGPVLLQSFMRAGPSSTTTNTATATANPSSSSSTAAAVAPNGQPTNLEDNDDDEPISPLEVSAVERRLQQLQLQGSSSIIDEPTIAEEEEDVNAPPMLIGIVVAPNADEARDARRAAARLERVGREIQTRWAEAQIAQDGSGSGTAVGDTGD
ncbi:uncharacterized protein F4822DRAFT_428083 [Hypoxylon trugodes]|uniref:uncharacterized protein n=1 Tax=Hypoxylon trugodes TaxID=326681 RepID=UPI00219B7685|nr:uncharacterized protein F4822DRAFT_428083 [Hypoxylon trugodes]KAI1389742.1 hypothetical protein F4822DRAFT_428083 [Hypoxylon trugodes]